ncbi:integrase [Gossypium australe]|uniref:Integrase n=1 Tax=Gossypium australe TaxID=47621 RepID=A0A5B6X4K3_9ROSI|nr:integrase [Gossypium australe]
MKDYDLTIEYHYRKVNVLADALSKKAVAALAFFRANVYLVDDGSLLVQLIVQPTFFYQILEEHLKYVQCDVFKQYLVSGDGELWFMERMHVPTENGLRQELLREAHQGPFSLYLGSFKMYQDWRSLYWWPRMKKEIVEYVSTCLTCQQIKAKHQVR